ncbi:hypothetical protein Mal15_04860 [Stieleria maiorica]|uniref:Uncharacterized protein n=1 Tax=Stieleria maiorica TaxID=2795974 RepID=A0A5B9M5M7_9BACT|nr:hypothetical protein [Stieleria maiorica]QEF96458.1 hypothetical protein Mal15_04860 [Stieleria maiorica]
MSIPVKGTATTTCDLLLSTDYRGGQRLRQTVVGVGADLTRTVIRIVPREANLIGVKNNAATFISQVTVSPIQNMCNFNLRMRRFQFGRAALGADHIEFAALSRGDVRARIRVATTLTTLSTDAVSTKSLTRADAFECFVNADASTELTLPRAVRGNVGLEYFFAVNPTVDGGTLKILCHPRDAIQIRESQKLDPVQVVGRKPTNGIVDDPVVKRVVSIEATRTEANKNRTSVVMACRAPGVWVAENPAAQAVPPDETGAIDPPYHSLWTLGDTAEDPEEESEET